MSTLSVVERILREAAVPMSVREIVERAAESLPTKSKTPDTVVARDLSMDIKKKGEESIFIRTSPGRYAMREQYGATATAAPPRQAEANGEPTRITDKAVGDRQATKPAAERPPDRRTDTASA
jgi:hypothetical protein